MTSQDKQSQQQPHHTQEYRTNKLKNKVELKNQMQAQWPPTDTNQDPLISMLQQLTTHK